MAAVWHSQEVGGRRFSAAGMSFIDENGGGAGVRLRKPGDQPPPFDSVDELKDCRPGQQCGDGGMLGRILQMIWVAVMALASCGVAFAAAEKQAIQIELNDLQPADKGCQAVFVLHNGLAAAVDKMTLRVVAFDLKGHATLFMSLDVGQMVPDKTRVLRFDLGADVPCQSLSRFVLDDITVCDIAKGEPGECLAAAELSSRASIPFQF